MVGLEKSASPNPSFYNLGNVQKSQGALLYKTAPQILVIASDAERQTELENSVTHMGFTTRMFPMNEAVDILRNGMAGDAILLDMTSLQDEKLADELMDAVLARLSYDVIGVVLNIPLAFIDMAYNRFFETDVQLLVGGDEKSWLPALKKAVRPLSLTLHDVVSDTRRPPLKTISEEVSRIARMLESLSSEENAKMNYALPSSFNGESRSNGVVTTEAQPEQKKININAAVVRAIIRSRRLRDQYFSASLFADPAWDMLLDLTAARLEGRQVSVSSLCIASAVPPTTALRWIKSLTEEKIFVRIADPRDGRRVFIQLSDMAMDAMIPYLAASISLVMRAL
ncbi:hypothetical protein [Zymomonas mobilis]|uniref:hypothetical protein n=1 Tax=Zymomonas mobilis TaxID=542 RepID=UPI0039EB1B7A